MCHLIIVVIMTMWYVCVLYCRMAVVVKLMLVSLVRWAVFSVMLFCWSVWWVEMSVIRNCDEAAMQWGGTAMLSWICHLRWLLSVVVGGRLLVIWHSLAGLPRRYYQTLSTASAPLPSRPPTSAVAACYRPTGRHRAITVELIRYRNTSRRWDLWSRIFTILRR